MNRTLISFLDGFNQFLAILITLAGAGFGWFYATGVMPPGFFRLVFIVIGGVGGFLIASLICGLLAVLLEIESHLRALREQPKA